MKGRILIIDDSPTKREMIRRTIMSTYEVKTASSGAEGLAMLEKEVPDLILLDVEMPDMDGYQTIQEIKIRPETSSIPVIFLTARTDAAAELFGLSLGAQDYITVPFSPPLLLKRIELHLSLVGQKLEMKEINSNLAKIVEERTAEIESSRIKLRVALDVAEAANRTKSVFIANMSHETRTPLNSIIGFSELAKHEDISDKMRNYVTNISESAAWLLRIINDILDISVIELGKIVLENNPFDFSEMLEYCHSRIVGQAEEKGLKLTFSTSQPIEKRLVGDEARLRQILMNMLSNAVKFTNQGSVALNVTVRKAYNEKISLRFEVKDTGIGMTMEQMISIYDPFMQGDNSMTRKFGGVGLGLTITKSIIELMGGTLNLESVVGIGSTFSCELTFDTTDHAVAKQDIVNQLEELEIPNFEGEILVCEDNSLNQQVILEHLTRIGLKVIIAHNGKEGVDYIAQRIKNGEKLFDLIFMDIQMPVMDGLKAVSKILALDVKTPIVALTANVMPDDLEIYKKSGMSDAVGKPFTNQELWSCLLKYLPVKSYTTVDKDKQSAQDEKFQNQLKLNFAKDNQNTYDNMLAAIKNQDIKTAHRMAHTLKSTAKQIGEEALGEAAKTLETSLKHLEYEFKQEEFDIFNEALKTTLNKLAPLLEADAAKVSVKITDEAKIKEIFNELEPMLISKNPDCEDMIDDIRMIPDTDRLVSHIENFKFKHALKELGLIKEKRGYNNEQ